MDRIYSYFARHGLIRVMQHGFMLGWSCLTYLIEFSFEKVINEGRVVDIVFMDFRKPLTRSLTIG